MNGVSSKNNNTYSILYLLVAFVCLLISVYCLLYSTGDEGYGNLWLLPFSSFVLMILFKVPIVYGWQETWSFKIVFLLELLRYVIIPFLMVYSNLYNSTSFLPPSKQAASLTSYLMVYELVIEMIVVSFVINRLKTRIEKTNQFDNEGSFSSSFIVFVSIIIVLFVIVSCRLGNYGIRVNILMFTLNASSTRVLVLGENLLKCVFSLLYFSLTMNLYANLKDNKNLIYPILFLSFFWIGIGFGNARMDYVIRAITVIYFVFTFGSRTESKRISTFVMLIAMVSIVMMTLMDENASNALFFFTGTSEQKSTYVYTLQKYFSGPYNIAKSIDIGIENANNSLIWHIQQFFTDLLHNISPFYKYEIMPPTSVLFNDSLYYYGSHTQIIPLIGQSYIYFGFILAPLLTAGTILLLGKIEEKLKSQFFSTKKFILIYAAVYLSFFRMYNLTIVTGFLWNVIFIGIIITTIQDKWKIKVRLNYKR